MEGNGKDLYPDFLDFLQDRHGEMQACHGGHNGSSLGGVNRLIVLLVRFTGWTGEIGGKGNITDSFNKAENINVGIQEPDGSATGSGVIHNLSNHIFLKINLVANSY